MKFYQPNEAQNPYDMVTNAISMPSGTIFEALSCEYQFHMQGKIMND